MLKTFIRVAASCILTFGILYPLSVTAVRAENEPGADSKYGDWDLVGPSGGDVRVVAIDPKDKNRLYVSTLDGSIHTSADGGKTWRLLVNLNQPELVLDQLSV